MKKYMKNLSIRLLVFVAALLTGLTASAATTVTVGNLSIQPGQQKDVAISIASDQADIYQIQASVSLPQGLKLVGDSPLKLGSLTQGFTAGLNDEGTLLISNFQGTSISASQGVIATLRVEADETLARTSNITLTGIRVAHTGAIFEDVPSTSASVVVPEIEINVNFAFSSSEVTVAAGSSAYVTVEMNNSIALTGYEARLNLPAGVTAKVGNGTRTGVAPMYTADANGGKIVCFAPNGITGNSGTLFTLTLTADYSFLSDAEALLTGIVVTTSASKDIFVEDVKLKLTAKDMNAKAIADNIVDDLQRKLDDANREIARYYPAAKPALRPEADDIQDDIDDLHREVERAFDNNTLDPAAIQETANEISEDIDEMLAKAKALQDVADLQEKLDDAAEQIPSDLPKAATKDFSDAVDSIQDMIDDLWDDALADGKIDAQEKQAVLDAIDALLKEILNWLRGDVAFNQVVNMDDFYALTDSILSDNLPTAEQLNSFYRFDANADEEINVGDMQGIINICLGLNANGSVGAREAEATSAELDVQSEETATGMRYTLSVKGMSYTGFQLDVEGAQVVSENARLTVRKNQNQGRTRLLAIGIEQEEGQVITIETRGSARLQNIVFTTAGAQTVKFDLSTTGINGLAAGSAQQKTYDLSGRAVKVAKGVVIVDSKKVLKK